MDRNVSAQLNCRRISGVASSPGGTIVPLCDSFGCVTSAHAVGRPGKPPFTLSSLQTEVRLSTDVSYLLSEGIIFTPERS